MMVIGILKIKVTAMTITRIYIQELMISAETVLIRIVVVVMLDVFRPAVRFAQREKLAVIRVFHGVILVVNHLVVRAMANSVASYCEQPS